MSASFSQRERLRRKSEFQRVYQGGKKIVSSSFILYALHEPEQGYRRLGITASRKIGNAVIRNRCKRLIRELFRQNKERFPEHADIVVVVTRAMVGKRYADLLEEACSVLQQF